jgi:hypothetical protein
MIARERERERERETSLMNVIHLITLQDKMPEMRPLCLEDFKAAMTKVKPNIHLEDVSLVELLPGLYRRPPQSGDE